MFDYAREKQKLDRKHELNEISDKKYNSALKYLAEADTKDRANRTAFAAKQINGLDFNTKEAEIVKEYDAKVNNKIKSTKHKKRLVLGVVHIAIGVAAIITSIVVAVIIDYSYKHRAIEDLPQPTQGGAVGNLTYENGFDTVELEFIHSYIAEGVVVSMHKERGDDAYDRAVPYTVGLAWGYAGANNDKITWAYNNRNLKAKNYDGLDRISIEQTMSLNEIIPADETVIRSLEKIGLGDHIRIFGRLVVVQVHNAVENYRVKSSEIRGDVTEFVIGGPTANEIIYVEKIEKLK